MANSQGIRINAQIIGADSTEREFAQARNRIVGAQRRGIKAAGDRAILPHARRAVTDKTPVSAGAVVSRSTTSYGYLTVIPRKKNRIVGYLNYGGRLPVLEPKRRKVLRFIGKDGQPVFTTRVEGRKHEGSRFLEKAVELGRPEYEQILLEEIMDAFGALDHTP